MNIYGYCDQALRGDCEISKIDAKKLVENDQCFCINNTISDFPGFCYIDFIIFV